MKKMRWWQHVPVLLRSSREPKCSSDHSSAGWAIQPYKAQVVASSETGSSQAISRYRGEIDVGADDIIIIIVIIIVIVIIIIIIDKASEWTKYLASIIFYYNEGGW